MEQLSNAPWYAQGFVVIVAAFTLFAIVVGSGLLKLPKN